MVEFEAELLSTGKTTTGFIVPPEIVEKLGGGRKPKVVARLGGYTMRSSVAFMGGAFWLGISAAHREGSGLRAGDRVTIRLELDTAPREVEVPDDFAAALGAHPEAKARFEALSYSLKRKHVLDIEAAKTKETRQRRIEKAIAALVAL